MAIDGDGQVIGVAALAGPLHDFVWQRDRVALCSRRLVFLNRRGREFLSMFGLNQGVFRVSLDTGTQRRMVTPPLLARGDTPEVVVRGAASRRSLPLETFGAQVLTVLRETPRSER